MSHPVPGHDYGENEYPSDSPHKDGGVRPGSHVKKEKKTVAGHMHGIAKATGKLQRMMDEPASKQWFKKHGTPKHKALEKRMSDKP